MKINILNFEKLPVIEKRRSAFYQLGVERCSIIKKFPEVYERLMGVLKFLFHFSPENDTFIKRAYLQAALSEFVSIEEILFNDLKNNEIKLEELKIRKTQNPLFHILKQFRNFNIHLGVSKIEYTEPVEIVRGSEEIVEKGEGLEYMEEFAIIDNLNLQEFNKLKDAKSYIEEDKIHMIDWFNHNQKKWGVAHLIYIAALQYCDEIIIKYDLKKNAR